MSKTKSNLLSNLQEAMSNEHTSYKSTRRFLSTLPTKGEYVIQGPGENAGIVDIGGSWAIALRIESHNHPSFINPYDGAQTGIGGILRDIFTMGARPIALLDLLRFGTDSRSKKLISGVVDGIADYGNCVGVPVVGGDVYFDKTFNHNCLVNVCAIGLVKKGNIIFGNALTPGNDLIYVGAKTGRDGIGGATMASANLDVLNNSAVQMGDPFLEKLLLEACCELSETDWVEGMQDMGAAGLLCSTTEVAIRGQKKMGRKIGTKIYLDRIPLKARNMSPEEILISESQERMLIVGKRNCRNKILQIFKHWDLEAHVIGSVTNDASYILIYKGKPILKEPLKKIVPELNQDWPHKEWKKQKSKYIGPKQSLMQKIWQQYDWMVGTRTMKGPDEKGHYAILDIPEAGRQLVISWSSDEGRSNLNPKKGIQFAFDKCLKYMQKTKAKPLGLTNCLNFGHPKDSLGALIETIEGLRQRCESKKIPVLSGNVSLYNAYGEHSIKPSPILVMIGIR